MTDSKKPGTITVIRWIARIWGGLAALFLLFIILGHLIGDGKGTPGAGEWIALLFFPFGVMVGLFLAYRWEGWGGIVAVGCMIAWHITMQVVHGNPDFVPFIDAMAAPGLLYILCWLSSRRQGEALMTAEDA